MKSIITLKDENVRILVNDNISKERNISLEGSIVKCIKHVYRYGHFFMPKDVMIAILWKAHKGCGCKKDHFDISQRLALYEHFKGKEIDDPYIQQFMKDTKENFTACVL